VLPVPEPTNVVVEGAEIAGTVGAETIGGGGTTGVATGLIGPEGTVGAVGIVEPPTGDPNPDNVRDDVDGVELSAGCTTDGVPDPCVCDGAGGIVGDIAGTLGGGEGGTGANASGGGITVDDMLLFCGVVGPGGTTVVDGVTTGTGGEMGGGGVPVEGKGGRVLVEIAVLALPWGNV
jgi:hypothetical protein